jgi:TolA-binding protein
MRALLLSAVLTCVFMFTGCAYYNTFYNAKKNFSDAVRGEDVEPGEANREILEKCVTRCEKVVKYHPRSKWVDDAVLLMGKCFYYMGEHRNALRKFEEMELYYSRSSLLPEAYYYSGLANQALGNRDGAITRFGQAVSVDPKAEFGERAAYQIARTYFLDDDHLSVVNSTEEFLVGHSRSKYVGGILLLRAQSLLGLERYEESIITLDDFIASRPEKDELFQAMMLMGQAYLELWDVEQALDIFMSLRREGLAAQEDARLAIEIAEAKRKLLHTDEAIKQLEEVIALYPKTAFSAEALFKIGEIHENELGDLESARKFYDRARSEAPYSEFSNQALLRSTSIARFTEYRERVKSADETELAEAQFLLAELYYLEFDKVDEAIEEYRKVLREYPDSEYGPKAAFAIAWVLDHVKSDMEGAAEAYAEVVHRYPDTPYSEAAHEAVRRIEGGSFDER